MAEYPPFMNGYGVLGKILDKIKDAKTPDRFTQDYLSETVGFRGGTAKAFIPLAKRIGLLATDGSPTELYKRFRNPAQSKRAMADAMRKGYPELFNRNENAGKLGKKELEGLIKEATGLDSGSGTLTAICGTFESLRTLADFDSGGQKEPEEDKPSPEPARVGLLSQQSEGDDFRLHLSYTINLNLPKTDDIAVFNAIFRSLKDNLLKK